MKHKKFNKSQLCLAVLASYSSIATASVMRNDVDMQVFRNFAENKGQFQAGAMDIPLYDKKGRFLGNAFAHGIPMPDFSAVEKNRAITTLVHPQYVSSAKHNSDWTILPNHGLTFGTRHEDQNGITPFKYRIVNRNDHSHPVHDFNTPRLNKMVTEVESIEMAPNVQFDDFRNGRFSAFARLGSGYQGTVTDDSTYVEEYKYYQFLTGGHAVPNLGDTNGTHEQDTGERGYYMTASKHGMLKDLLTDPKAPIATYVRPGDSGSPLFGYDWREQRWYVVGYAGRSQNPSKYQRANFMRNLFAPAEKDVFERKRLDNLAGTLAYRQSNDPVYWSRISEGNSSLTHRNQHIVNVPLANNGDLDHGKDLVIAQSADDSSRQNKIDLVLRNDIDQGAGGLYFTTSGKVRGQNPNTTWVGSGVFVDEGKKVEWQVKNPEGDRISKLGKGELLVNGSGVNQGSISVGAGKVTLAQKASGGKKQAFSEVQLASGRGTVEIADADQLKHTKLSFGHRGGTLDLNNNNLTIDRIHHMDDGANITNRKTSYRVLSVNSENVQHYKGSLGHQGGSHLSFNYSPKGYNGTFAMSGDMDLKGYVITNKNAKLVFTGAPTQLPDLYSPIMIDSQTEWKNRRVIASSSFYVRDSGLIDFGRNLSEIRGTLKGSGRGTFRVGFVNGESLNCLYSTTECENTHLSEEIRTRLPTTEVNNNVELRGQSQLILGKAALKGRIDASNETLVRLAEDSTWTLMSNSNVGTLRLEQGSKIHLNPDNQFDRFYTLTVNRHLLGNGHFRFSTNLANLKHNKLILKGRAEGRHTISLVDSGQEPNLTRLRNGLSGIRLIEMNDNVPQRNLTFVFEKGYVDAGAYRYVLNQGTFDFRESHKPEEQPAEAHQPVALSNNINNSDQAEVNKPKKKRRYSKDELWAMLKRGEVTISQYIVLVRENMFADDEEGNAGIESRHVDDEEENESNNLNNVERVLFDESIHPEDELLSPEDGLAATNTTVAAVQAQGSQAEVMSQYANQGVLNTATAQRIASQSAESLLQQWVGSSEKSANTWVSVQKSRPQVASNDYRSQAQDRTQTQFGTDVRNDNTTFGVALSENRANQKDNVKLAGAYLKQQWDNRFFTLVDAQLGRAKSQAHRQDFARLGVTAGLSLNAGKASFTPYVGVAVSRFSASNYRLDAAEIAVRRQVLPTYHAGAKLAYNVELGSLTLKPFAAAHYVASHKTQKVRVNHAEFNQKFDNRLSYQAGLEVNAGRFSLSTAAGTTKGRELKRDNRLELKASFVW